METSHYIYDYLNYLRQLIKDAMVIVTENDAQVLVVFHIQQKLYSSRIVSPFFRERQVPLPKCIEFRLFWETQPQPWGILGINKPSTH